MTKKPFRTRTAKSSDDWQTPPYFYNLLDKEFNFTLDPCASYETIEGKHIGLNALCPKYYTERENGLIQNWEGEVVFVNPPFSQKVDWIKKCFEEGNKPNTTVVMLIPATPDPVWWHEYIMHAHEIRFCNGRVNFIDPMKQDRHGATFPLAVVIWHAKIPIMFPIFSSYNHKENRK